MIAGFSRDIGDALREARERAGVTQKDLARLLKLSQAFICDVEGGRRAISAYDARTAAVVLNVSGALKKRLLACAWCGR